MVNPTKKEACVCWTCTAGSWLEAEMMEAWSEALREYLQKVMPVFFESCEVESQPGRVSRQLVTINGTNSVRHCAKTKNDHARFVNMCKLFGFKINRKTEIEVMLKTQVEKFNEKMNSEKEKVVWNERKPVGEVASLGEDAELVAKSVAEADAESDAESEADSDAESVAESIAEAELVVAELDAAPDAAPVLSRLLCSFLSKRTHFYDLLLIGAFIKLFMPNSESEFTECRREPVCDVNSVCEFWPAVLFGVCMVGVVFIVVNKFSWRLSETSTPATQDLAGSLPRIAVDEQAKTRMEAFLVEKARTDALEQKRRADAENRRLSKQLPQSSTPRSAEGAPEASFVSIKYDVGTQMED